MRKVAIDMCNINYIKLPQLLKLVGIISTGGEIKSLIQNKVISVNGNIITEFRKKIYINDIVEIKGFEKLKVIDAGEFEHVY